MCGRYVSPTEADMERYWELPDAHIRNPLAQRFNVAPPVSVPILFQEEKGLVLDAAQRQHKVRPEKAQHFGNRAKQYLSDLIYQKEVDVEWRKYDRYGRIVGKIMIAAPNSCPPVQHDCPRTWMWVSRL